MKKYFKITALLMVILLMATVLFGCAQKETSQNNQSQQQTNQQNNNSNQPVDTVDAIKKAGKLVVGTSADYPPFEFHDISSGKDVIAGFDIDLAKAIAKELGVELEIKDMSFDTIISAVLTKKVDMGIAGFTITEERKKSVNFSIPYIQGGQQIITYKGSGITGKDDLKGKTVGVQLGTTGEEIAKKIEGAKLKQFDKVDTAVLDLLNKKVDAVIVDFAVAKAYASQNSDKLELVGNLLDDAAKAVVLRKEDEKLLEVVNKVITDLKNSGELDKMVQKWFVEFTPKQ